VTHKLVESHDVFRGKKIVAIVSAASTTDSTASIRGDVDDETLVGVLQMSHLRLLRFQRQRVPRLWLLEKEMKSFEVASGITITDDDLVDFDNFIAAGEYNPHNVHPFVIHDHGFVLAVIFESNMQDALDAAVDANKMDRYLINDDDLKDYTDEEGITYLGNASEPFDIQNVEVIELTNPPRSFVALLEAAKA
jgi:hypothetical protein